MFFNNFSDVLKLVLNHKLNVNLSEIQKRSHFLLTVKHVSSHNFLLDVLQTLT